MAELRKGDPQELRVETSKERRDISIEEQSAMIGTTLNEMLQTFTWFVVLLLF
jgi:hypothetical protein